MKKEMSTLTIKSFDVIDVELSNKTEFKEKILKINNNLNLSAIKGREQYIKNIEIKIIHEDERDININSIIDIIPISTKVTGMIGEGITHTLNGVCVMLTGCDEKGIQVSEFGSSEGILKEQVVFNRPGTPRDSDIIILVNVTLIDGMGTVRKAIAEVHKACDNIVQDVRECMKKIKGTFADEVHEYNHVIDTDKKNVVIIKQVAGQGAMYDTCILPNEPSGVEGSHSIIDLGNMPIVLTPNEYRDGAIRAMC